MRTLAELYAPTTNAPKVKGKQRDLGAEYDGLDEEDEDEPGDTAAGSSRAGDKTATPTFVEAVPGEIAAKARRSLRRDVESKLAESSRRFLTAFAEVDKVR